MQLTNRARRSLPWTPPTNQTSSTTSFSPCRTAHASTCTAVRYGSSQTVSARRGRHSTAPCTGMCSGSTAVCTVRKKSRGVVTATATSAPCASVLTTVTDVSWTQRETSARTLRSRSRRRRPCSRCDASHASGGALGGGAAAWAPPSGGRSSAMCVGMPRVHARGRGRVSSRHRPAPRGTKKKILLYRVPSAATAFHRPRPRSIGRDRVPSAASLPWRVKP